MREMRPAVVLIPIAVFTVLVVAGAANGDAFMAVLNTLFQAVMVNGGWLVSLGVLAFVVFMVFLLIHPIGNVRLGGKNAQPEYSLWNWFAISLCAGIGTGIVFWGPVEPLLFTQEPQQSSGVLAGSYEAVIWAFDKAYLHWSFAPYACYCVFGVIIAYAFYNMKAPFSVSSVFAPLLGKRAQEKRFKGIIDTLAVFALTGGVAGSLGYGLLQIGSGLNTLFGLPTGAVTLISICVVIVAVYTFASISGIDRGIRWLSDKNAWIFFAIMILAFLFGPMQWVCNLFVESFGSFVSGFVESLTAVSPFPDDGSVAGAAWAEASELWPQWWDEYYFVDFLSFAAIVGLFSIKLAKGRTVRQFVLINWLLPAMFGIVWFAIFGGLSLDIQYNYDAYANRVDLEGCASLYDYMLTYGNEAMMLKVIEAIPFSFVLKPLMLVLVALSLITMADTMTSTISLMSMKNSEGVNEAPSGIKLMWGIIIGAAALVFTLTGSIDGIKIVKTIAGYPVLILGLAAMLMFLVSVFGKKRIMKSEGLGAGSPGLREELDADFDGRENDESK